MRPRYKKKSSKIPAPYRSKLEHAVSKRLPRGKWKYEPRTINYSLPKRYKPDFVVETKRGHEVILEVKGYLRYEDQQKMRAVRASNPGLDIRMFFASDGKVQGSDMSVSEWCNKYGFPYAIGIIPRSWFE